MWPGQAANVRGQDAVSALLHGSPTQIWTLRIVSWLPSADPNQRSLLANDDEADLRRRCSPARTQESSSRG
jgi:hypothetical protein